MTRDTRVIEDLRAPADAYAPACREYRAAEARRAAAADPHEDAGEQA